MGGVSLGKSVDKAAEDLLQWGPPGMGGVRISDALARVRRSLLQWGPPGMGGVSVWLKGMSSQPGMYFNGDLPEWEV